MVSFERIVVPFRVVRGSANLGLALVAASALAGCSADIARFDFPTASLAEGTEATGSASTQQEQAAFGRANLGGNEANEAPATYAASPSAPPADSRIEMSALPEPSPPVTAPAPSAAPSAPVPQSYAAPEPAADAPTGEMVEVQRGDTLYGLSKRHRVSLNELMRVNGLTSPALKPGQKLYLPVSTAALPDAEPRRPAPVAAPSVAAPADWNGSYTIKPGDSLYAVARRHNVKLDDLTRYNGISDVRRVRPGTVLKIPGDSSVIAEAAGAPPQTTPKYAEAPRTAPITSAPIGDFSTAAPATPGPQLTILNAKKPETETPVGGERSAAVESPTRTDVPAASAPAAPGSGSVASNGKLRWPAKGRVVTGFGPRPDGTHNDGINIAVPMGTDVHAAEDGVVAYAGDQLKGYGNLILIRHEGGIVTAYAHSDQMLVKRNDRVTRGQVIAKAGKTGHVDQPQVHFEVRKNERPVDPAPMLE